MKSVKQDIVVLSMVCVKVRWDKNYRIKQFLHTLRTGLFANPKMPWARSKNKIENSPFESTLFSIISGILKLKGFLGELRSDKW